MRFVTFKFQISFLLVCRNKNNSDTWTTTGDQVDGMSVGTVFYRQDVEPFQISSMIQVIDHKENSLIDFLKCCHILNM